MIKGVMFTGIIEGLGTITDIQPAGQGKQLTLDADFVLDETKIGDSIAVNGVCLTVVVLAKRRFHVDVSPETFAKTTLGKLKVGSRVNLERALRLSDRIGGHLVAGHVDGLGNIKQKKRVGNGFDVSIIPHTAKMTIIGHYKIGDLVNIEADMIGKYVERFVLAMTSNNKEDKTGNSLNMQLLAKTGFI